MNQVLFHIKTDKSRNPHLTDDDIVRECMERLQTKYPQVLGYQWERVDGGINILMWGAIHDPD